MRLVKLWGILASILLISSCKTGLNNAVQKEPTPGPEHGLTLLHTNDIHGGIFPRENPQGPKGQSIGGAVYLEHILRGIRGEGQATLLVDAGDLLTGSPASEVRYKGIPGGGLFEMFNLIGYDAWTLGNHEFDGQRSDLLEGLDSLTMPTLCANLTYDTGAPLSDRVVPYTLIAKGELTIAVAGLITHNLHRVLPLDHLEGLALASPIDRARELVQELDPVSDVIVFLTHQGLEADRRLARAIPEIDVIVGGHSHTLLKSPIKVGNTLIVQAGSDLLHLGRLDLIIQDDRITSYRGQVIPLLPPPEALTPSAPLFDLVTQLEAEVDILYGRVIADIQIPLIRQQSQESNIGDWLAELIRQGARTQIGLINGGGIRRDIPAGPLTLRKLKGTMPFDNKLATFTLTGAELKDLALHNAQVSLNAKQGILQIAGFSYVYQVKDGVPSILELRVGGEPVNPEALYSVASSDYVVFSQPFKYLGLAPSERQLRAEGVFDTMVKAIGEGSTVRVGVDGRMKEHHPNEP